MPGEAPAGLSPPSGAARPGTPPAFGSGAPRAKRARLWTGSSAEGRVRIAFVFAATLSFFSSTGLFASQESEKYPEVPTIPVEEIHAGMRGHGMSVFRGTTPERFEVEVLGVLANQKPAGSYILARLSGKGLESSGVIAGMSGSPVYFDGRLAGAVAFSWPFAKEPIAGITPIAAMRAIGELREGSGGTLAGGGSARTATAVTGGAAVEGELQAIAAGEIPATRLDDELARFASAVSNDGRSSLLWGASGFGEGARSLLSRLLPESALSLAATGGGERPTLEAELVPGASVAALFIDGDLRLAATGTVTDRIGGKLFAFGHSGVGVSEISLPLANSEVITVMPSALASFKLANSGKVVGRFERDHTYGAVGEVGLVARTVPLVVRVLAPVERRFELRLGEVPQLLPALAAIGTLGSFEVASGVSGNRSADLALRIALGGPPERAPLALEQSFEGESAGSEAIGYLMTVLSYLVRNDLAPLEVRGIEVDVRLYPEPRAATLTSARPSRVRVAPGERLELSVDARGWRGESLRWSVPVRIPDGLTDGRYSLLVGDGASADGARLGLEPAAPTNIDQAVELLRSLHSSRDLVVLGVVPGAGLASAGEVLPRLPGSMRSIWGGMGPRSATVMRNAIVQIQARRLERPLAGLLRVELDVRRPPYRPAAGSGDADNPASHRDRDERE